MNPLALLHVSPGMGEVLLVLLVILILFGADQLPGIARTLGKWLHQVRRTADEFHDQLLDADRPLAPREDGHDGNRGKPAGHSAEATPADQAPPSRSPSQSTSDGGSRDG